MIPTASFLVSIYPSKGRKQSLLVLIMAAARLHYQDWNQSSLHSIPKTRKTLSWLRSPRYLEGWCCIQYTGHEGFTHGKAQPASMSGPCEHCQAGAKGRSMMWSQQVGSMNNSCENQNQAKVLAVELLQVLAFNRAESWPATEWQTKQAASAAPRLPIATVQSARASHHRGSRKRHL